MYFSFVNSLHFDKISYALSTTTIRGGAKTKQILEWRVHSLNFLALSQFLTIDGCTQGFFQSLFFVTKLQNLGLRQKVELSYSLTWKLRFPDIKNSKFCVKVKVSFHSIKSFFFILSWNNMDNNIYLILDCKHYESPTRKIIFLFHPGNVELL